MIVDRVYANPKTGGQRSVAAALYQTDKYLAFSSCQAIVNGGFFQDSFYTFRNPHFTVGDIAKKLRPSVNFVPLQKKTVSPTCHGTFHYGWVLQTGHKNDFCVRAPAADLFNHFQTGDCLPSAIDRQIAVM